MIHQCVETQLHGHRGKALFYKQLETTNLSWNYTPAYIDISRPRQVKLKIHFELKNKECGKQPAVNSAGPRRITPRVSRDKINKHQCPTVKMQFCRRRPYLFHYVLINFTTVIPENLVLPSSLVLLHFSFDCNVATLDLKQFAQKSLTAGILKSSVLSRNI